MSEFYTIKDAKSSTATYDDGYAVFQYSVCWRSKHEFSANKWNITYFANKKYAQEFARKKKKENKSKPYPYIIQTVVSRNTFKMEVQCERCNIDFKSFFEWLHYKKFIKY